MSELFDLTISVLFFRKSLLVFDPTPVADPPPAQNGLNCVLALDVADDLVIKRSAGRTCKSIW